MRKILLSGVAFALLAVGPALAADLPRKAPPPVVPPPLPAIWNGWYVGLNAGAGWNNNDFDNVGSGNFCAFGAGTCALLLPIFNRGAPVAFGTDDKAGFIGGGQIGYNYQAPGSVWVWGFETDFQGADIHRAGAVTNTVDFTSIGVPSAIVNFTETGAVSQRLNFLGTLRGRLGWSPSSPWLLYLTGGLAYGHVETEVAFSQRLNFGPGFGFLSPFFPGRSTFVSKDDWRAGWTVGGGVEWMFAPRWSLKGEYLYYDLGRQHIDSQLDTVFVSGGGVTTRLIGQGIASEASNKGSIARAGINYHFGAY